MFIRVPQLLLSLHKMGFLDQRISMNNFGRYYQIFVGGGHGNPPQYSCLENHMGRGGWSQRVLAKSQARPTDQSSLAHSTPHIFISFRGAIPLFVCWPHRYSDFQILG